MDYQEAMEKQDAEKLRKHENVCQLCGGNGESMHGCPYREDIDGDYDYRCNCCDACRHECAMDI